MQAVGGAAPVRLFNGDFTIAGTTITRANLSSLGSFLTEGFAAGQLIQVGGTGTASDGTYHILSVAADGQSMILTTAPAAGGTFTSAFISRIVNKGLYTGRIAYDAAAGTLTRTDGTSWLDDGFLEGQLFQITGLSGAAATYKIESITGTGPNKLDVLTLTGHPALPSGVSGTATLTVTQWAAVATFTPTNWYVPVTVNLLAD